MEKTAFKGKVYMTHPTKAIYKWMLSDYVKVTNVASDEALYTDAELSRSYDRVTTIDYHQEIEVDGIRFTALNAGHVLGAAMFVIEIAGVRLLYTGDYSREEDRHLMAAETPAFKPEVLICESTYGVQMHQPRAERERRFTGMVHEVVKRGGRCLIPVFALGRAQELLLILDEYWQAHHELQSIPIYYASPMANKCMAVYQTYVNMMNDHIRREIAVSNPFVFKHIKYLRGGREAFKDAGPCVMMASPGMLQNGFSRELFELWAPNKLNGLIIPGYVVEGTMGKYVLTHPKEVNSLSGAPIPLKMSVEYISFSAHVDFAQNSEFIDILKPPHLVLVHGEQNEMFRLKAALNHKYGHMAGDEAEQQQIMNIHTPKNCEQVSLTFAGEKLIKLTGRLAKGDLQERTNVSGVLVGNDFDYQLVAPEEVGTVSGAKHIRFSQTQTIHSRATTGLLEHLLGGLVGQRDVSHNGQAIVIKGSFELVRLNETTLQLSWEGNVLDDLLADSIISLILSAEVMPSSVKISSSCIHHHHSGDNDHHDVQVPDKNRIIREYLEGFYGPVEAKADDILSFSIDGIPVRVGLGDSIVDCEDEAKKERVVKAVSKISSILSVDYII